MLQVKDFKGFVSCVPSKVEKLVDTTPVCVLKHVIPAETMQMLLEVELTKLASRLNVANNLSNHQIVFTAQTLLEDYKSCSLEDFIFVFTQMAKGAYGSTYHQLDTSVISQCMSKHLEAKAYFQERDNQMNGLGEVLPEVDYEAFKRRTKQPDKVPTDFKAERERQLSQLNYTPPSKEYAIELELKREWGRRFHHPHTGEKTADWIPFNEFKEL